MSLVMEVSMATENYGAYAELVESIAQTPVSTDTFIYFIGTCASGELHKAHLISSFSVQPLNPLLPSL